MSINLMKTFKKTHTDILIYVQMDKFTNAQTTGYLVFLVKSVKVAAILCYSYSEFELTFLSFKQIKN